MCFPQSMKHSRAHAAMLARSLVAAVQNTGYFKVVAQPATEAMAQARQGNRGSHVEPTLLGAQLASSQPGVADGLIERIVAVDKAGVVRRQKSRLSLEGGANIS